MVSSVISPPIGAIVELSATIKIHKYKRLHEGHHTPRCDMDHFIKECACFFHNKQLGGNLFLSFCNQFFKQHVNIALERVLVSSIEKKIVLASDVCSKPPIRFMICM